MNVKGRKAAQSEQTRRLLLDVARDLFAERGYAGTATEEVVQRAGVTRGALYYHFRDKQDLFRAVVEDLEAANVQRFAEIVATITDPWEQLRAGLNAYLDACMDPAVQRIILQDAPSVFGWMVWREIDERYGFGLLLAAIRALIAAGYIAQQPAEPLAHLLLGALSEAGLVIAHAEDVPATRAAIGASLDRLLEGMRARPA
jgi:AcrR family transcriptional regulator